MIFPQSEHNKQAQPQIENYLSTLRSHLRGVSEPYAQEFLAELRSHIYDKISDGETSPASVDEVLTALGSPKELAREFSASVVLDAANESKSSLRMLLLLFRWASLSVAGLFVFLGAIAGYFVGGVLLLCAAMKPLHPHAVGLWAFHDATGDLNLSFRLGSADPPAGAHELLGWWIVPLGVLAALVLILSTSRLAQWCVRKFRASTLAGTLGGLQTKMGRFS